MTTANWQHLRTRPGQPSTGPAPSAPFADLFDKIRSVAAERERERHSPAEHVRELARAGFGALRVPRGFGGAGLTLQELLALVIELGASDPNIAQALRSHFLFVEARLRSADTSEQVRWFELVTAGLLFGNAVGERNSKDVLGFSTRVTRTADGLVLDGRKYYTTGTLYSDWVAVAALGHDDSPIFAVVPVDRAGVGLLDDWDGMGQRLTASGTTIFDHVAVAEHEILPRQYAVGPDDSSSAAFAQLYLLAVMVGVMQAAAQDAAELVRGRQRTYSHASSERPADDHLIHQVVGRIASYAAVGRAAVLDAAARLDVVESCTDPAHQDGLAHEAALATSTVQVVVSEYAPQACELIFDVGGASATSREMNLDRHWRNVRTLASHNPAMYKARAIGDLVINATPLPRNGFF
jgi:alkylation response protein AidB-like acyl-CoA dehydrogenase